MPIQTQRLYRHISTVFYLLFSAALLSESIEIASLQPDIFKPVIAHIP
jgi:hypothetical protein